MVRKACLEFTWWRSASSVHTPFKIYSIICIIHLFVVQYTPYFLERKILHTFLHTIYSLRSKNITPLYILLWAHTIYSILSKKWHHILFKPILRSFYIYSVPLSGYTLFWMNILLNILFKKSYMVFSELKNYIAQLQKKIHIYSILSFWYTPYYS